MVCRSLAICMLVAIVVASPTKPKNLSGTCRVTPGQSVTGPLYKPDQPKKSIICERKSNSPTLHLSDETAASMCSGAFCFGSRTQTNTTRLLIRGRVLDTHCLPLAGAVLDVWQPDTRGVYSSIHPGDEDGECRGVVITNSRGEYEYETYRPGTYGAFSGAFASEWWAFDLPPWVPQHIHLLVYHTGFIPLITQLYFNADPVVEHDFRARMAGLSLGALDDGLRISTGACTDLKDRERLGGGGGGGGSVQCATVDLVIMKAAAGSKYAGLSDHTRAVYEAVCVDALEAAGKPLAFCNPWVEPLLRPIILGPVLLAVVGLIISIPVWLIVKVVRVITGTGRSGKSKPE